MAAAAAVSTANKPTSSVTEQPRQREQQQLLQVPQQAPASKEAIVLEHNFDRLSVLSISAEISVDDEVEDDYSEEKEAEDKHEEEAEETKTARLRLRAKPAIGLARSGSNAPPRGYKEAAGDARLAWRWVEGWRARLRKGGDVVEKARWEWRVERRGPVVVVREAGEGVGQGLGS